ncbi:hypothetical protein [Streptacidiphilus neutrinimicus]|uniref:hypothetical protein n=1 Tax=Streptacidiphilus neutrinimicus TaxID=105420 RepID=UPI0005A91E00|nr:hypothetical protein [Streptacidiphilus neutrinimicus]
MSRRHEALSRAGIGRLGALLLATGVIAYVLAADGGHWWGPEIVPRDCAAVGVGDNCTQVLLPGPDYVPHGPYGWLGWLAVLASLAGVTLLIARLLRAGASGAVLRR